MIGEGLGSRLRSTPCRGERRAVIDIGSNTVRLVIYGGPLRAPEVLWNEKVSARLGRDLAKNGMIPADAMEEALAALMRFALLVRELGIRQVETVATAAARDATNGADFIGHVRALGLDLRVLDGEEEAQASAHGVIGAFPGANGVVADLGGGSLELISVAADQCSGGASYPLGTLRLPSLRSAGSFERKVTEMLQSGDHDWSGARGRLLYLIGGTWRAFAAFAMRSAELPLSDPHGFILAAKHAERLAREISRKRPSDLAQLREISMMRAEKLPDASALLRVLLSVLEPEALVFSSWGLREGLHFQRLDQHERARDPLLAGVEAFATGRAASLVDAEAIARWAEGIVEAGGERTATLRLVAAQLAVALHRVEPNLRAPHALEWSLDKRWIGLDFRRRAMLGAALRASLGLTDPHARLLPMAGRDELREATAWGLAIRLAQRFSAGSAEVLAAARLSCDKSRLDLAVVKSHAALVSPSVAKDFNTLARWLGLSPRLNVAD